MNIKKNNIYIILYLIITYIENVKTEYSVAELKNKNETKSCNQRVTRCPRPPYKCVKPRIPCQKCCKYCKREKTYHCGIKNCINKPLNCTKLKCCRPKPQCCKPEKIECNNSECIKNNKESNKDKD